MPLNVNQLQLSRTLTRQGSGFESARGRSDGRKEAVASSVPFSVPFAVHYIENEVEHAICCAVSCSIFVLTRIRFLPRSPTSLLLIVYRGRFCAGTHFVTTS